MNEIMGFKNKTAFVVWTTSLFAIGMLVGLALANAL